MVLEELVCSGFGYVIYICIPTFDRRSMIARSSKLMGLHSLKFSLHICLKTSVAATYIRYKSLFIIEGRWRRV